MRTMRPPGLDKLTRLGHGRKPLCCGKLDYASSLEEQHRARKQEQRLGAFFLIVENAGSSSSAARTSIS